MWLTSLSNMEVGLGDLTAAQKLLERALEIGVRTEGRRSERLDVTMLNLGTVLRAQEDYGRARVLLEQALEMCERVYGKEHAAVLYTWGEMGDPYFAMGDHDRARQRLRAKAALARELSRTIL